MAPPFCRSAASASVPQGAPELQTSAKALDEGSVGVEPGALVERELLRPVAADQPEHDDAAAVDAEACPPILDGQHELVTLLLDAPIGVLLGAELEHFDDRLAQADAEALFEEARAPRRRARRTPPGRARSDRDPRATRSWCRRASPCRRRKASSRAPDFDRGCRCPDTSSRRPSTDSSFTTLSPIGFGR